ncbi:hypothetical protein HPB51_023546 [Rhipicephalus microplus]|uniref:Uncharacterized protein n=1 Tax=Rhipicephalus microplus TaxID=6941 RepID=A0A9J6E4Y0_RHIMP|nr:hypothetical protein HPB51_023546 [Rhipicephalus microplus]
MARIKAAGPVRADTVPNQLFREPWYAVFRIRGCSAIGSDALIAKGPGDPVPQGNESRDRCHGLCSPVGRRSSSAGVGADINHRLSLRNISVTDLFLACSNNWCTEVLPRDPSDIWHLDDIGIIDGQDDVRGHPASIHFRSTVRHSTRRYEVPPMIKTPGLTSWTNQSVAESKVKRQRFEHHPEVLQEYHDTITPVWSNTPLAVVANSLWHSGFVRPDDSDIPPEATPEDTHEPTGNMDNEVNDMRFNSLLPSGVQILDYVAIDYHVAVAGPLTDDDILSEVLEEN